jgi:hypothetical protein
MIDRHPRLRDVQARASNPAIQVFAAVNAQHEQRREQPRQHDLYGCIDFICASRKSISNRGVSRCSGSACDCERPEGASAKMRKP